MEPFDFYLFSVDARADFSSIGTIYFIKQIIGMFGILASLARFDKKLKFPSQRGGTVEI